MIIRPKMEIMYLSLFNAVTDAIEKIDKMDFGTARAILVKAQQDTEDIYINDEIIEKEMQ